MGAIVVVGSVASGPVGKVTTVVVRGGLEGNERV